MKAIIKEILQVEADVDTRLKQAREQAAETRRAADKQAAETIAQARNQAQALVQTILDQAKQEAQRLSDETYRQAEESAQRLMNHNEAVIVRLVDAISDLIVTTDDREGWR